jgi:hypothetical protein
MVRRAVMSTATLGRPWVQPKAVATTKGKAAEACPGQPSIQSLAPVRVGAVTSFTRGRARGASIARFSVQTVSDQGVAFHAAWYRTAKACAAFRDSSKFYVVTSAEGPTRLAGTDDVVSRTERIYYDAKHHHLAYARHFITARTGRALSSVEYDFLTSKSDPQAKDFSTAQHLLTLQLTRTRSVFSS